MSDFLSLAAAQNRVFTARAAAIKEREDKGEDATNLKAQQDAEKAVWLGIIEDARKGEKE